MREASWQKRALAALTAATLGLGGAAFAGEGAQGEDGQQQDQVGIDTSSHRDKDGNVVFRGADEVGGQEPGSSADQRRALIGAESLSVQDPGSGGGMVDATEISAPGSMSGERPDLTVALTVGLEGYTSHLGGVMMNGVGYGIRVGGRFWENVGLELEYSGTRSGVEREWAPENGAAVSRNAVDLVATGGRTFDSGLRPYGGIGFGLGRFSPNGFAEATFNGDWYTEVPLVAGLDYQVGPVYAGLRGTWRFLMGEEFANEARGIDATGNMLGVSLNVGGRF